jgi:hypothetical protein
LSNIEGVINYYGMKNISAATAVKPKLPRPKAEEEFS